MAKLIERRVTAEIEGDFVVFLIGMRINRFWKPWKWLPVFGAMPKMISELEERADAGFLGLTRYWASPRSPMLVQYWRSFEHLESYARSKDAEHWPAWVAFNEGLARAATWDLARDVPGPGRPVRVRLQQLPATGLGAATNLVPAAGRKATAASRAGVRDEAYPEDAGTERIEV